MLRVVAGELSHRRGRALALLLGILMATTSFTVLTGASATQRLNVRGTVQRYYRGAYDVLVRPRGSRTPLERRTGQAQPNFLSGLFGGISFAQWRAIQRLPGVEVAAPIANVGYLMPTAAVRVAVSRAARAPGRALLRARITWRSDRGLTRVPDAGAAYAYVTPNVLRDEPSILRPNGRCLRSAACDYRRYALQELVPGRRRPAPVCTAQWQDDQARVLDGPFAKIYRSQFACFSRRSRTGRWEYGPLRRAEPGIVIRWAFPLLLTAIHPDSEARLDGFPRAMLRGRYLRPGDKPYLKRVQGYPDRLLPVLAASRPFVDQQADIVVERLARAAADRWAQPFSTYGGSDWLDPMRFLTSRPPGAVVERVRLDAGRAYARLLGQMHVAESGWDTWDEGEASYAPAVWRIGPTRYRRAAAALRPQTTFVDDYVWQDGRVLNWAFAPPTSRDTRFREITKTLAYADDLTPPRRQPMSLQLVGVFDPGRLGGASRSIRLTSLQPPVLRPRGALSQRLLHGRPLESGGNLGGYLSQPPGLVTTLAGARAFGPPLFPGFHPDRAISAIRVRVAGVTGIDALSRERIRAAAQRIATRTGLDVDITAGSSAAPLPIDLAAGRFGRPRLALTEDWIRKGVAARVLTAIDRKSLVLFVLILVVCALFVANATSAAVRARRTELGILASLGWTAGRLFAVILVEVAVVGLAAGVAGGLLALPLATLAGVDPSPARAALAVPAATLLAVLAGLAPALRAARADPIAAVRPAVLEARRAWRPRTLSGLAAINILRTPGRTALGALSLAIGVCALTLLLAATLAFHDTLVGTLLGDAVAVTIRASDYVAVTAIVLLGIAAVADVLFLSLRERSTELATLTATGWDDGALGRLLVREGLWIGGLGALAGAATGLLAATVFAGALPAALLVTTFAAALTGTLLAGLAGLVPAAWLRRTSLTPLLAGE